MGEKMGMEREMAVVVVDPAAVTMLEPMTSVVQQQKQEPPPITTLISATSSPAHSSVFVHSSSPSLVSGTAGSPPISVNSSTTPQNPLLIINIPSTTNTTPDAANSTPMMTTKRKTDSNSIFKMVDNPQDAWLPITESRNGNSYYSAFHILSSGIGVQALVLPVSFTVLGWFWGIISLSLAFVWQLYTLWLLIQLHESVEGTRYSRYLHLCKTTFGEKLGKMLALIPTMYLSGGTCITLIIIGGESLKLFFQIVCGPTCKSPLTTVEWYLVFVCLAIVVVQLPNLNSIAWVSLAGAIAAIAYCTLIWTFSITRNRPAGISYDRVEPKSGAAGILSSFHALGIIAFAFRGHNVVLEIQGTMPSSEKHPSRVPMWRGVKIAYLLIAVLCLFPLAVGGYWAYGNKIPANSGLLNALHDFHKHDTSRYVLGLTTLLVVINSLTTFQIYAMLPFDNVESAYTSKKNKPCPRWVRSGIRIFLGFVAFFIAVALPFLGNLAGLIGGIALPITFAYPCFMWITIKKPERYSPMWCFNWVLGSLGIVMSLLVVVGGIWSTVFIGVKANFFSP